MMLVVRRRRFGLVLSLRLYWRRCVGRVSISRFPLTRLLGLCRILRLGLGRFYLGRLALGVLLVLSRRVACLVLVSRLLLVFFPVVLCLRLVAWVLSLGRLL